MQSSASSDPGTTSLTRANLLILGLLSGFGPLAIDMYLPGFTAIARDLDTPASSVQLTLTAFLLGLAFGQLVIGTLSDQYGRRRPLLVALVVSTVAGLGTALAPTIGMLIALRAIQGFTGAAGVVIARSIVRDRSSGRAGVQAFSLLAAITSLGPVIAPLMGGALLPFVGWRGILGTVTLITAAMLVIAFVAVPESLPEARRTSGGLTSTLRAARNVFRNQRYVGYLIATAFTYGAIFAYISASPFVLQNVFGLSSSAYALAFTFNSVGLIIASAANARLVTRFPPTTMLLWAQVTMMVVVLLIGLSILADIATIWTFLPLTFIFLITIGFTIGNGSALALNSVSRAIGSAAAVLGAVQFLTGALTSPLVGLGGEDTAIPMVLVMGSCAVLAFLAVLRTRRRP